MNSKQKGKRGELELAHTLSAYGFASRRGQQYCGSNGDPDVIGLKGVHIECKRVERLNLNNAYAQAVSDTKESEIPVVIHRTNRKPWMVTMSLDDWVKLYEAWIKTQEKE